MAMFNRKLLVYQRVVEFFHQTTRFSQHPWVALLGATCLLADYLHLGVTP